MANISDFEDVADINQTGGLLEAGFGSLNEGRTVVFDRYTKFILPIDGTVFWIRSGEIEIEGSLHYAADKRQNEDETAAYNNVIFTTTKEIESFGEISPSVLFIARQNSIRFAFARRDMFYEEAGLYHYTGLAVLPTMVTQLIDQELTFDETSAVVSNSLPIWLSINQGISIPGTAGTKFPLIYPSFAVPDNLQPPYIVCHIDPNSTEAVQAFPTFDVSVLTHTQLVKETVRFTLYGMRNSEALDFQDYVNVYSLYSDLYGIMNTPVMRDEKRTQVELSTLAQKKTFTFEVDYYQVRVDSLARQLILTAIVTFQPTT